MKVKAKIMGFYNNKRVAKGMEFFLENPKHFDAYWMESLEPKKEAKAEKPKPEAAKA